MSDIFLKRTATYQILNVNYNTDLGLFRGKMGCAIFFYNYAKYIKNSLFSNFADELLDDIFENIQRDTPLNFYDGLSGIGFGIQYLISQKYVEADSDVLDEFDIRIMEFDPLRMKDYSLESGIEGYAWYILSRLFYSEKNKFDSNYLNKFLKACHLSKLEQQSDAIRLFREYYSGNRKEITDLFLPILQKIALQKGSTDDIFLWQHGLRTLIYDTSISD